MTYATLPGGTSYGRVEDRPDLLESWEDIKRLVYLCVQDDASTRGSMTSINLFHYGLRRCYTKNPVTIFITVNNSLEEDRPRVIATIKEAMAKSHFPPLNAYIELNTDFYGHPDSDVGRISHLSEMVFGDYGTAVNLGDAIGEANIEENNGERRHSGYGALGCYVEIRENDNSSWQKYALTSYTVVRATLEGSDLQKADESWLLPGDHKVASLSSPPRAKHDYTIGVLRRRLEERITMRQEDATLIASLDDAMFTTKIDEEIAELEADIEKRLKFFEDEKHILGKVYAASGVNSKTPENGRLDWALVKVNEARIGNNILPGRKEWGKAMRDSFATFGKPLKPQTQSISHKSEMPYREGYKYAASTGATHGRYHEFKSDVNLGRGNTSSEYIFQTILHEEHAQRRDSGSVIYDRFGGVLGLVFGGLRPKRGSRLGFMGS